MNKVLGVLQSRKFWASVVGLLAAVGVLRVSDVQETNLVTAVLTIVTTVAYVLATAIEDAGRQAR